MVRRLEKSKAIKLRKQGKTYNEICKRLGIPKSTLSGWLSGYPLTEKQIKKLSARVRYKKLIGMEKTSLIKYRKKQKYLKDTYKSERRMLLPVTARDLYVFGLALYWGEGRKGLENGISLNNTDPRVVKFFVMWLTKSLNVPIDKMKVSLHLYQDMDPIYIIDYWSRQLGINKAQFIKPYIKESNRLNINQKGYGHGTCGIYVYNRRLKEKIIFGIDAIAESVTGEKPENLL